MGPMTMVVCPTPEQLQYVHHNTTNGYGGFFLGPQILSLLITLVGLVGNGLVLWLLGFGIQRNPFSVYVLNLAAADALFLCFLFLIILDHVAMYSHYPATRVLLYLTYMFYTVGLSLLAAISSERCLSVLFPIWYRCHRPKHTSAMVCAVLWVLPHLVCGTISVICHYVVKYFCHGFFFIIIGFTWFLLLSSLLCVSSLTLLLRVQCSSQRRQPPSLYLLVLLSVIIFLLCGLPMGIVDFLYRYFGTHLPFWLAPLLASVNSSANPFIYFYLGIQKHRKRRDSLRVILQRALGDKEESADEARNSPSNNTQEILS